MTLELQIFRVLLIGNFVLGLAFVYYLFDNRERRAATSLIVLFCGLLIWLLADIIQVWTPANPAPPVGIPLRMVGADITIIGLLLFAFEYTGREGVIRKRVVSLLSIKPVLSLAVVLTPSLDGLLEIATAETVAQGYEFVATPFFIFHVSYNWILTAVAIAVLLRMLVKGMYGNQRQLFVVLVAVSIPISCNVLLRLGVIRLDLTTAAFFMTATGLMYATFRLRLLDALPIARQTVLAEMDELVFVLDETGAIVTANNAATERFGHERELAGTHITAVLGSDVATIQSSGDEKVDIVTTVDNMPRHFTVSQNTLTDNYEMVVGQLLVCRDVTERVHRERELEETTRKLELLNRIIRHDINNDMTVIIGRSEHLLEELDDELAQENLESIIKQGDHVAELTETVHNLMEAILNDSNTTKPTDLDTVLNREIESVRTMDDSVTVHTPADPLGEPVQADEALATVFRNLLTNAVRHNDTEQPTISISITDAGTEVVVRISDNGPGVPEQSRDVIFGRNEKGLESPGTGIGLYLVETLVSGYGGTVWIETSEHGGATFAVRLQKANSKSHGYAPTES